MFRQKLNVIKAKKINAQNVFKGWYYSKKNQEKKNQK